MFKKKITENTTIRSIKFDDMEIRLSQAKIEIEKHDKTWKQVYAAKTRPFVELSILMAKTDAAIMARNKEDREKYESEISNLCYALYGTTLFFYYPELCREWIERYNKIADGMLQSIKEESKKGVQGE